MWKIVFTTTGRAIALSRTVRRVCASLEKEGVCEMWGDGCLDCPLLFWSFLEEAVAMGARGAWTTHPRRMIIVFVDRIRTPEEAIETLVHECTHAALHDAGLPTELHHRAMRLLTP